MTIATAATGMESVQSTVSHNVRILMAHKGFDQQAIANIIHLSAKSVGHKLSGRSAWSLDELVALSLAGGEKWPVARFLNDPDAPQPTVWQLPPKLAVVQGSGRSTVTTSPMLHVPHVTG